MSDKKTLFAIREIRRVVKLLSYGKKKISIGIVPTNSVPAVAVIQRGLAFSILTGLKAR
jgi:hypothetical protein